MHSKVRTKDKVREKFLNIGGIPYYIFRDDEMTRSVMRTHENQKSLVAHQTHFAFFTGLYEE